MYYNAADVEQFIQHKDYIDTAIVSLIELSFQQEKVKQVSSSADFIMALTAFVEQQFKGRLMVTPPFTYVESLREQLSLVELETQLKQAGFKHVFFLTSDSHWTSYTEQQIIWLPAIPLESMDKSVKQRILEDQLKQVIPKLTTEWSK